MWGVVTESWAPRVEFEGMSVISLLHTFTCGIHIDFIVRLQHVYLHCSCTVVQFVFCSSAFLGLKFC